jgi:bifunctional non-homologous end joining protein LigD
MSRFDPAYLVCRRTRFPSRAPTQRDENILRHACKLGLEGIVSKRKESPYRSGRSPDW